jgi:hypothetical protein
MRIYVHCTLYSMVGALLVQCRRSRYLHIYIVVIDDILKGVSSEM